MTRMLEEQQARRGRGLFEGEMGATVRERRLATHAPAIPDLLPPCPPAIPNSTPPGHIPPSRGPTSDVLSRCCALPRGRWLHGDHPQGAADGLRRRSGAAWPCRRRTSCSRSDALQADPLPRRPSSSRRDGGARCCGAATRLPPARGSLAAPRERVAPSPAGLRRRWPRARARTVRDGRMHGSMYVRHVTCHSRDVLARDAPEHAFCVP